MGLDLTICYEELRGEVLMSGECNNRQRGYGVFVHRGMRAWMEVCRSFYPERRFEASGEGKGRAGNIGDMLPSGFQVDMAHILTGIVLEQMKRSL